MRWSADDGDYSDYRDEQRSGGPRGRSDPVGGNETAVRLWVELLGEPFVKGHRHECSRPVCDRHEGQSNEGQDSGHITRRVDSEPQTGQPFSQHEGSDDEGDAAAVAITEAAPVFVADTPFDRIKNRIVHYLDDPDDASHRPD